MSEIVNHSSPRLVPLLGHCTENGNLKFLIYMSNQDLPTYLRPDALSLVWKTRLKITIGVMEGLYYLYHQCFPPLVQSGILLDEDFEVRLGSLTGDKNNQQRVYSGFEQSNSDEHFIAEACAVAFVAKACLSTRPCMCPDMAALILQAVELHNFVRLIGGELKLGGKIAVHNHVSLMSRGKKVYLDGEILPCPSSRIFTLKQLMDATQNFGKESWLGRDEFGRVYQGLLVESGTELHVAVKRMNLKIVEGFKAEVELVGRLSHPNILKPLGYCLEDNELLFVYEFMQKGSLKRYLYTGTPPLTWDLRLKILTGAARALAFLHESQRQGVFHHKRNGRGFYGYFKCSKVLLDSDYNAKITGFSAAEIDPPDCGFEVHPLRLMSRIDEYAAPEYKIGGCSYLKSDVYGFGIVLVRMLSGRETHHVTLGITDHVEPLKFVLEKMDPRLQGKFSSVAAAQMVQLAQLCVRQDHKMRPSMQQVVQILQEIESNPQYLG